MEVLGTILQKSTNLFPRTLCRIVFLVWLFSGGFVSTRLLLWGEESQSCSFNQNCTCNATYVQCNNLSEMTSMPVGLKKYSGLIELDFNNNAIERIKENDFVNMELLQIICLANNSISSIHPSAFRNLYFLQVLNLEGNKLVALDPSGLMFQHLSSLKQLFLQNNKIVNVSRYAFLTLGPIGDVSINLDGNPIRCDCETLALRDWEASLVRRTVQISLQCANDGQRRSYKDVENSVFGYCNSSQNAFSNMTRCFICQDEDTSHKCNSRGLASCPSPELVCRRTVTWNASDKIMNITSKCDDYQACLADEAKNNEKCALGPSNPNSVSCNFCCREPTCVFSTIGGRTKDLVFYLIFKGQALELLHELKQQIPKKIKEVSTDIGVLDAEVYEFTAVVTQYTVVLKLFLTTLNTNTEESVWSNLTSALETSFAAPSGYLRSLGAVKYKLTSYLEGLECNATADLCPTNLSCIYHEDNRTRCLCDNDSFFEYATGSCLPVTELRVKNISVKGYTQDSITLAWSADNHGTNVKYTVQISPNRGLNNYASSNGIQVLELSPATQYNFTVTSTLTNTFYTKNVSSSLSGIWTKAVHGNSCSPDTSTLGNTCTGSYVQCLQAMAHGARCLCASSHYFSASSSTCRELMELQVRNLKAASSTTDTVTLTWAAEYYGVRYIPSIVPNRGQLVPSATSGSEATWSGLDPGTQYNVTVISMLQSDTLYSEKNVSSPVFTVWTKAVHGNSCTPYASSYNNTCVVGEHIVCLQSQNAGYHCLCSPEHYNSHNNTCRELTELRVKDLTVLSSTHDTVTLTWIADNFGTNVRYIVQIDSDRGHVRSSNESASGARLSGLEPGTRYTFTVISMLDPVGLYLQKDVASTISSWTKNATNVTVFIKYDRQNEVYQPYMNNSNSTEYLAEENRIVEGVKPAISKKVNLVSVQVDRFEPTTDRQYKVLLNIEVITFDTNTTESVINDAIQDNAKDPDGFFYKEKLKSLEVSSKFLDTKQCPYSVTSLHKGVIKWDTARSGLQNAMCPYNDPLSNAATFATRECLEKNYIFGWGEVNDSLCVTKEMQENPDMDKIFDANITAGNARFVSSFLKTYTEKTDNFTAQLVNKTVRLLEQLAAEEMLAQPAVVTNVMGCVSNLINVDEETLKQSERETTASKRLLSVIDSVSNKTPLTQDSLRVVTDNLAVAAHRVDSSDTEDIILFADTDFGSGNNGSKVNVDFSNKNSSLREAGTNIVIPVAALLDSLTLDEKSQVNRVSFIVHRTDILFASIENTETRGVPLTNTTKKSANEESDGSSDQPEGKSLVFFTKVNSQVISASIPGVRVQNLSSNITMSFEHLEVNATNARCMFWDESKGNEGWADRGCGVVTSAEGRTTCGCNHLTNFALLMDVYGEGSNLSDLDRQILSIISYVGCGISFIALLLTLLIYCVFRQVTHYSLSDQTNPRRMDSMNEKTLRRDNPSKILINLCVALLCSNLVFLVGMQDYAFGNTASCKAVAVLLHYFLLASLCWMAVEAFYMYLALVRVFKTYFTNFILKCSLVGWGVPLVIIIITLAVNTTDNYGFVNSGLCWLTNPAFYAAFVAPVCFILLVNCLAFLMVVKQLVGMSSNGLHKSDRNSTIQRLRGAVGVVILLGLSWIFAIFAIDQASVVFYYLFAVFNSLQGLFIFIFYCLLKKDAILAVKRFLPCFEEFGDSSKSYTNSRGITAKSANHNLAEHKSLSSSKYNGSTSNSNSTSAETRKDSCFSTLSGSSTLDSPQGDTLQPFPGASTSKFMSPNGPPHPSSQSIRDDLRAYIISQPEHAVKNLNNEKQNSATTDTLEDKKHENNYQINSSEIDSFKNSIADENSVTGSHTIDRYQNSTSDDNSISNSSTIDTYQSADSEENVFDCTQTKDSSHTIDTHLNSNPETTPTSTSHTKDTYKISTSKTTPNIYSELHTHISSDHNNGNALSSSSFPAQTSPNIQQTDTGEIFAHLEHPKNLQLSPSVDPYQPVMVLNPSFSAEGEIDYSHTARVDDIKKKFEQSTRNTS